MWGLLTKVGLGVVATLFVIGYAFKKMEPAKDVAPEGPKMGGGASEATGLSCDAATKALPKAMQDLIAVTVGSGKAKLIQDLAADIQNGVDNGTIDAAVGKKLVECLKGAAAPLPSGSPVFGKPVTVDPTKAASLTVTPFKPIFPADGDPTKAVFAPESGPWPAIQSLPDNSASLGSPYNWRSTLLNALAGIDYDQFVKGTLAGNGKKAFPSHIEIFQYMVMMNKDPILQAGYSGLGGALPRSLDLLQTVYDKLKANGY